MDIIFVRNVAIQAEIGFNNFGLHKTQPALISVRVSTPNSVVRAAETDNIEDAMDYRKIYKAILKLATPRKFQAPMDLAEQVCHDVLQAVNAERVEATVALPKSLLHSEGIILDLVMSKSLDPESPEEYHTSQSAFSVKNLVIPCIIGIGAQERKLKQPVLVNLKFQFGRLEPDTLLLKYDAMYKTFEHSDFKTLEAFVTALAGHALQKLETGCSTITVNASKPSVFAAAEGPGVEIVRSIHDFP